MKIHAENLHFKALNEKIKQCPDREIEVYGLLGQRYIGCLLYTSYPAHGEHTLQW